jgi:hypothetical protein
MSEKDKKAFALRISPNLLKEIEQWASSEFRSTNGQIEYLLNEAVKANKRRNSRKENTKGGNDSMQL